MLTGTFALSIFLQATRMSLGQRRLVIGTNVPAVLAAHAGAIVPVGKAFELELDESDWQSAVVGDFEDSMDRSIAQAVTYWQLLEARLDPAWTTVTAYYAAFFAVRTFLIATGSATRNLVPIPPLPGGLYSYSTAPSVYPNRTIVTLKASGGDSHRSAWAQFATRLDQFGKLPGVEPRAASILASLAGLLRSPTLPSQFRNQVNYALEPTTWTRGFWSSELRNISDGPALESRILGALGLRDEQRIEVAMLAAANLASVAFDDYLARTPRPDRRRSQLRRASPALTSVQALQFAFGSS